LRRLAVAVVLAAVVLSTGTAAGALGPGPRSESALSFSPVTQGFSVSRVRHGPPLSRLPIPKSADGQITVIVGLRLPPLAARAAPVSLFGIGPRRKLDVAASSSQAYLARLDSAQEQAIARIHALVPKAKIGYRFRIVLDGITVTLPYSRLPTLLKQDFAAKVYPSARYTFDLNRSTALIGAPQFRQSTGATGEGVKVGVVDDGIDNEHPFFNPAGFSYPAGFPKGPEGAPTSPKVIVARGFPGPKASSAPLDRDQSFHGTFVSGIIGGVAGTDVPAGRPGSCSRDNGGCHPAATGLSGVAPRAWLGNYRVFNVPQPLGGCCSGNTPQIVAAFEAAVADGMDVINFSGGGPQSDPRRDALIDAVANVSKAGVVPVISAGNDRDFFGLGTVGSPGTAPDAISVGATANAHVFTAAMHVVSPNGPSLSQVALVPSSEGIPSTWETRDQPVVDVGTIRGTNGQPVDRRLCAPAGNPNDPGLTTLPAGSLQNVIALVTRGGCTFDSKAARAQEAGANGLIVVEDQPGDPGFVLTQMSGGMISDLDGAHLRQAMASNGGRAMIRVTRPYQDEIEVGTSWGGVPTSFSAGGLTPFGHQLKPDIMAPGAQILSSTLPEFAGDDYMVSDGTSFSAPHISGLVALLLQRHPTWTPPQVKSALMSTAGPAYADTARTQEVSVVVEGAGMARVEEADHPFVFTEPQSLSFGYLPAGGGATSKSIDVTITDAGGGAGTWQTEIQAQTASAGTTVEAAPVTLTPGGVAVLQVVARVGSGAVAGDDNGFVLLRRGDVTRRIPYAFSVTRSGLAGATVQPLKATQSGSTATGTDRARIYRWPTAPFGITSLFGVDTAVNDVGAEKVYSIDIPQGAVNAGAVITSPALRVGAPVEELLGSGARPHPWFLGSLDENDALGYAGMPSNANSLMPDFIFNVAAAGVALPPPGRYYVVVDSGRDPFTGRSLGGPYVLHSWVNDVKPPRVQLLTKRVSAGRPTIVARITDDKSGVDPLSMLLLFRTLQIGATSWDPKTGIAVFPIPRETPPLNEGLGFMRIVASDFQESKNITDSGNGNPMPNTQFQGVRVPVIDGATVSWVLPGKGTCVRKSTKLLVVAGSSKLVSSVGFYDGTRQIARVRKNVAGLYSLTWHPRRAGTHQLTAVASDTGGHEARATLAARVCG
jgi:minor extracellular serine protease Vpr